MGKQRLNFAYLLDGQGGGNPIDWDTLKSWTPEDGLLWADLNYQDKEARAWLTKESNLDRFTSRAMLVELTRPRFVNHEAGLLIILRGINLNPGQDPEDMVSVRIWLDENRIIIARHRKVLSIEEVEKTIREKNGPKTPGEFLRKLNERLVNRMSELVSQIDDKVDGLEEDVINVEIRKIRPKIVDIRREVILIKRFLSPQRDTINSLLFSEQSILSKEDKIHLRETNDKLIRCIEDLDALRERSAIILEELNNRLSEELNHRMYILSIVAAIFLPLSFVTGLFGVNVGGIPGSTYKWGFVLLTSILVSCGLGLLWYFRRRKWM